MQLKTIGFLTAAAMLSVPANAGIVIDLYAGLQVGAGAQTFFADSESQTDSASAYGAVLGVDIPLIRAEGEYNYIMGKDSKLHVGMLNAYLKMPSTVIMPYIGVGVGSVFGGDATDNITVSTTAAYQGMLGITFDIPVTPLKFDIEGRALYAPNLYSVGDNTEPDLLHYDARLKLRYVF